MKIIGVVQLKGGAGRSTLSTTLAGELSKIGATALLDCDVPQGSSASWAALRLGDQPPQGNTLTADTVASHRDLLALVTPLKRTAEYVILDGPPRIAEMTRAILGLADLVLVPIGASPAEVWATADLKTLIDEAEQVRKKLEVRLVWTRFRGYTNLAQELSHEAGKALGLPALRSTLGYRVAYAEALGAGKTAAEVGDAHAREEVAALVKEVTKLLK